MSTNTLDRQPQFGRMRRMVYTATITMDDRHNAALAKLCAEQDMDQAQVLRQALRVYQRVQDHAKKGERMVFVDAAGVIVPELLLQLRAPEQS